MVSQGDAGLQLGTEGWRRFGQAEGRGREENEGRWECRVGNRRPLKFEEDCIC